MASHKNIGILYIDAKAWYLYENNFSSSISFPFPKEFVSDLEIYNSDQLKSQIELFLTNNKVPPASLIVILSDVLLFGRKFPKVTGSNAAQSSEIQDQIAKFESSVPFQHVASKTYPADKEILVFAANKDFYDCIREVFEKKGFSIDAVLPLPIIGNFTPLPLQFSPKVLNLLRQKIDVLKQHSFLIHEEETPASRLNQKAKPNHKRIFILGGVFGILAILFILLLIQYLNQPFLKKRTPLPVHPVNVLPSIVPSTSPVTQNFVVPGSSSASLDFDVVTIQIQGPVSLASPIISLKKDLTTAGFKHVETSLSQNTNVSKTTLVIAQDVALPTKDFVIQETKKFFPNAVVIESLSSKTIIITIGS